METRIVKVPFDQSFGHFETLPGKPKLERWTVTSDSEAAVAALKEAADYLRTKDTPVAFPTETVYGLGADATRSGSTKGIYTAKGRPSDNPLIVHVPDLEMLRDLLGGNDGAENQIPSIYQPLIERFWPGPLTILLPNPTPSKLAPEVTSGLPSFGVRMPSSPLALSLIKLAGVPLAAPSANASTKPSPTTAQHVKDDLDGRIELILDGGPCNVGVESTVVDGLCDPPVVLRPGGVGMDELRSCAGWEKAVKGYKDSSEVGKAAPRAPGMKYKHYSPKAKVVLYESTYEEGSDGITPADIDLVKAMENGTAGVEGQGKRVGIIRTRRWRQNAGFPCEAAQLGSAKTSNGVNGSEPSGSYQVSTSELKGADGVVIGEALDIDLGKEVRSIAQGIFSALRELDRRQADIIFVDGIDDEIDIASAVMNRLRKAASELRS